MPDEEWTTPDIDIPMKSTSCGHVIMIPNGSKMPMACPRCNRTTGWTGTGPRFNFKVDKGGPQ